MEAVVYKIKAEKHPAYKNSGAEWLGEIPEHWDTVSLGSILELKSDKNHPEYEVLSVYREYGVIKKDSRDDNHNATSLDTSNYKAVTPGDLVVNKMKAWQGSMGVSSYQGIVSPAYITCRIISKKIHSEYLHQLLRCNAYIGEYNRISYGVRVGQWDMHYEDFKRVIVVIPPKVEQTAITKFLDRKIALIDQAINIKENQIELLKERRQILIHRAVTRGLNPDVKMKESGVEWIREIPEHWEVIRLKYVVTILKRIIGYEGPDVLSITQQGIKIKDVTSGEGQLAMDYSKYQIIQKGEFAMNHMDLLTGYVDISKFEGVISPDYRVFTTRTKDVNDSYLLGLFQVGYKSKIFYKYGQGVSQLGRWRFPEDNFNNFKIPIPPIQEQIEIVHRIERQSNNIVKAIAHIISEIGKLKEYKATLINSAVTGKINVCGAEEPKVLQRNNI